MFRDLPVPPPSPDQAADDIADESTDSDETHPPLAIFCGATYLLGETCVPSYQLLSTLISQNRGDRNFTKNVLIDWERAEVLEKKEDEPRLPRTVGHLNVP